MAVNFSINAVRKDELIYVDMIGDFDGSSAFELINYLNDRCGKSDTVMIDTSHLNNIHPFGRKILERKHNSLKNRVKELFFSGERALEIAPE